MLNSFSVCNLGAKSGLHHAFAYQICGFTDAPFTRHDSAICILIVLHEALGCLYRSKFHLGIVLSQNVNPAAHGDLIRYVDYTSRILGFKRI